MGEEENGEVCDTELCLSSIGQRRSSRRGKAPELIKQEDDGNITLFYNGKICICDVKEIQARAIISMAKKEMEVKINNNNNNNNSNDDDNKTGDTLEHLQVPYGPKTTASSMAMVTVVPSMKRSLQRFLQKRKTRRSLQFSMLPYQ